MSYHIAESSERSTMIEQNVEMCTPFKLKHYYFTALMRISEGNTTNQCANYTILIQSPLS